MSTSSDRSTLESCQKKQTTVRKYGGVATRQDYLPDPTEPVDRWFQSVWSSNARTTARVIADLYSRHPAVVIDPFCGAGSSAVAARMLGVRFIGIELDPVLACIANCKLLSDSNLSPAIYHHLDPRKRLRVAPLCRAEHNQLETYFAILCRCRALQGRPITAGEVRNDLPLHAAAIGDSQIIVGNSLLKSAWSRIHGSQDSWVIYTSPPFDDLQTYGTWPRSLKRQAKKAVHTPLVASLRSGREKKIPEQNLTHDLPSVIIRVLENVGSRMGQGFAIIEHERANPGMPSASEVARQISASAQIRAIEILETAVFSARGMFSLILCEIAP